MDTVRAFRFVAVRVNGAFFVMGIQHVAACPIMSRLITAIEALSHIVTLSNAFHGWISGPLMTQLCIDNDPEIY